MRYLLLVAAKYRNLTLIALAVRLGDNGKTFFARAAGFDLRHREEESLAVIAEMHSQSDESQISMFGGDKQ